MKPTFKPEWDTHMLMLTFEAWATQNTLLNGVSTEKLSSQPNACAQDMLQSENLTLEQHVWLEEFIKAYLSAQKLEDEIYGKDLQPPSTEPPLQQDNCKMSENADLRLIEAIVKAHQPDPDREEIIW